MSAVLIRRRARRLTFVGLLLGLSVARAATFPPCSAGNTANPFGACQPAAPPGLSARAALGRTLFFDPALSASGKQSCASCHAPAKGFSSPDTQPTPLGGAALNLQGPRNVPTLTYALYTPAFSQTGPTPPPGQPAPPRPVPAGGFLLDGRAATLAAQAQLPFLAPFEMANKSSAEVLQRLKARPYLAQFSGVFGAATLNSGDATLQAIGQAIAAYESEDPAFQAFNSKFDAVVRGQASLSAAEANGRRLFDDPTKGNCAACHSSTPRAGQPAAIFSNRSFHNLGVPRNWQIAYNRDATLLPSFIPANGTALGAPNHQYYDLGLCGPFRTDLSRDTTLCGSFKTPTLRNAALKPNYFHNSVFNSLNEVVSFYASRDSNPARWYKRADGTADSRFNDLPTAYVANVQRGAPFRPANAGPALSDAEIRDVVAFICTLTDGFDPKNPAAYALPAQCRQ